MHIYVCSTYTCTHNMNTCNTVLVTEALASLLQCSLSPSPYPKDIWSPKEKPYLKKKFTVIILNKTTDYREGLTQRL